MDAGFLRAGLTPGVKCIVDITIKNSGAVSFAGHEPGARPKPTKPCQANSMDCRQLHYAKEHRQ